MKYLILGRTGSGKSYLATEMGKKLGLPVHHLDSLFWLENWVQQDRTILAEQIREIMKGDKWIIEGNYRAALAERLSCADRVIVLDLPLDVCIENIRTRHKHGVFLGMPKHDTPNPHENVDELVELAKIYETKYAEFAPLFATYKQKTVTLKTLDEVNNFLYTLEHGNRS